MDGPAGRPADNPPNSDPLGVYHQTVPELTVQVYWQPGPPIWQQFSLDTDQGPKWRSRTVANITLILPKLHDQKSLTLGWRSFSRLGRERVGFSVHNTGGQYFIYDFIQPGAPQITQNTRPTIVDAQLMLIFVMWKGACLCLFGSSRRPIHGNQTVMYQCRDLAINSSITECDDKWWNPKRRTADWILRV